MRLEYGFDIDGDGSPDTYRTTLGALGPTSAWSNVVSLKLHFVTRSLDKAVGSNLATAQEFDLGGTERHRHRRRRLHAPRLQQRDPPDQPELGPGGAVMRRRAAHAPNAAPP